MCVIHRQQKYVFHFLNEYKKNNTIVKEFASAKRKLFKRESTMEIKMKKKS